jgi:nifR3 family TIM-barrel protein
MKNNFWKKLKKPFFVLAPMLDITDSPFRQIISECGKPDVFYTWFVSVDGLCSEGKDNILRQPNLNITRKERPIVVQLFGKDPEKFYESARILSRMGFDGIDINMGCPNRDVLKQEAGAELIKNPKLAREIIKAAKRGAESASWRIPVSVKTRIGYHNSNEMRDWILEILEEGPAAICLHGRTMKQKWGGISDWEKIAQAAELIRKSGTLLIGNGDIKSTEEGLVKIKETGVDGVMIGRAVLLNPWMFGKSIADEYTLIKKRMEYLVKHAELFEKYYGDEKGFGNFRKYVRVYVSGFDGSKELRIKLMKARSPQDVRKMCYNYIDGRTDNKNKGS